MMPKVACVAKRTDWLTQYGFVMRTHTGIDVGVASSPNTQNTSGAVRHSMKFGKNLLSLRAMGNEYLT
ncbi:MAG: hypothetical protein EBV41_00575 [Actinobacteria bacterium]|nr:hypothetical protein [Actinomycetota bacterium]